MLVLDALFDPIQQKSSKVEIVGNLVLACLRHIPG